MRRSAGLAQRVRIRNGVAATALASGVTAIVVSRSLYPHLSADSDESVYLLQADALRHGSLLPVAHAPAEAFRPWLTAIRDGHYVPKYTPVHASVIAAADAIASPRVALAAIAAATICSVYLLACEVLRHRRQATIAAVLVALSPLFILESATYLPYVGSVGLLAAVAAAMLRWTRTRSSGAALAAGALLGTALFARPYDALLFATPFAIHAVVVTARSGRTLLRGAVSALAGAALPVALMFGYFWRATGSPWELPFQLLDPADTLGFGRRHVFPGTPFLDFTTATGVRSVATQATLLVLWTFGGGVAVVLSVMTAHRLRREPAVWTLCAAGAAVLIGYGAFWGAANALGWGGPFDLGPWYSMPAVLPLAILSAVTIERLVDSRLLLGLTCFAVMACTSAAVLWPAVDGALIAAREEEALWSAVDDAVTTPAIVFLAGSPGLGNPLQQAVNPNGHWGPIIWARTSGGCADVALAAAFPGRKPYSMRVPLLHREAGSVTRARQSIVEPVEQSCDAWERDSNGNARMPTHDASAAPAAIVTPGEDVPNPFVLRRDGQYYLYSSQPNFSSFNVPLRTSSTLGDFGVPVDAMPDPPPWVDRGWNWAPDVREVDGHFVMWFTAADRSTNNPTWHPRMCIGVATSSSPLGPFESSDTEPRICQHDRLGSIDPRTFVAADGQRWLHWKSDDNADPSGARRPSIYAQRLAPDGVTLVGEPKRILEVDQAWEGPIIEAPQLVESNGALWLFYSGNWFNQPVYGIGVARCDAPDGPCTKPSQQPWLSSNAQGKGPGEASLFLDGSQWRIAYSPWAAGADVVRPVAVASVAFDADGPHLRVR